MGDTTEFNPNDNKRQKSGAYLDGNEQSLVEEAATQFARLFFRQCIYERQKKNGRTLD